MLQAPAALSSYLTQLNPSVIVADFLTISLPGSGTVLRYTNGLTPVTAAASLFPASSPFNGSGGPFTFAVGPRFDRVRIPPRKIGLDEQQTEIKLYPTQSDLIGAFTWQAYAFAEEFDAAVIEVDRFHWSADGSLTPLGAFITIYCNITDVDVGRTTLTFTVKTLPYLLQQPMPRRMYQALCNHPFGGPMCGYDRVGGHNALGAATGIGAQNITAQSGSGQSAIMTTFSPSPATAYNQGTITGTSGTNNLIARTIAALSGGAINVTRNFPFPVSAGDGFQLLPGCDHTLPTCANTFNNAATTGGRFGGTPYVPPPEESL